ncbi:GDSL esterase/lipase At5g14450-like [Corylus avellana]|uniref:GDSL esterase/lipase At5g14450-like n=1 Tax=Corylus avellana TaxID=13451 RepID=UPI002869F45B|nr:GDSL esterase/lipase At5g14450-like [Corylus avellana]
MRVVSFFAAGILVSWVLSVLGEEMMGSSPCNFPAIYNFGDSNSDTGGNSAAFYPAGPPSGETFFHQPAGRGSDGRLIIDFIAKHLRLPYLSAYLDSIGTSYRHGANFATGGARIRRFNTSFFVTGESPFSLDIQIVQFDQFKSRTSNLYKHAKKHSSRRNLPRPEDFSKALYTFDIGQNDIAASLQTMSNEQLKAVIPGIVDQLATAVEHLYQNGARTFWIHNTGPIGCLPVTQHHYHRPMPGILDQHGCVIAQNDMAKEFNRKLKSAVIKLREQLPDAAFTYVDVFAAKYKLIGNAKKQGFVDARNICCGYHEDDSHVYCGNKAKINGSEVYAGSCEDPSLYISWDGVHYTEAANHWIANHIVNGSFSDPPVPITHACHKGQSV